MRAAARLMLFYTAVFVFLLLAGASVSVMEEWLRARYAVAANPDFAFVRSFLSAATNSAPMAAYCCALLVPPVAAERRGLPETFRMLLVCLLIGASLFSVTYAANRFDSVQAEEVQVKALEAPGMTVEEKNLSIAYLDPADKKGSAVLAPKGSPLKVVTTFEANAASTRSAPSAALLSGAAGLDSIVRDLSDTALRLKRYDDKGPLPLLAYSISLGLLLAVVGSVFGRLTNWPLAGVALCAPAFRGILILDRIIDSGPFLRFIEAGDIAIPKNFLPPAMLASIALIVFLIGVSLSLAKGRMRDNG